MTMMVQAAILLVSGVYYGVDVLPGWLQAVSGLSPATYLLRGIRSAVIDGRGVSDQAHNLLVLGVLGVVLVPASVAAFALAERWAKTTGRLKRQG
jgi:ABC-2 type transport system permease protein